MSSTYTYNTANQRTKAELENGEYWDYAYDDLGQVTDGKGQKVSLLEF